ncbi:RHS repeat-associated core domain-containing protein [Micromonospora deserti]|uniref:RHS repeat-associated core domain-containing protein n=1 Tax=Micromonospora deserti TaxID=2070366 RepID=UPI001F17B4EB|nr:RHS repeat-associated core domain-containing protein [Micromonospora deserti]
MRTFTRPVSGLSAIPGIFNSESSQVDWQITNLHGDLVAAIHGDDEGLSSTSEATEYGTPRNPDDIGAQRYGWLGAKQRAADTPSGIVLMGVRLYNTVTGRFLQVDPVDGGSCNAYEYTCGDPVNKEDLDGKWISIALRAGAAACKIGRWCIRSAKWAGKQWWRYAKFMGKKYWGAGKWLWNHARSAASARPKWGFWNSRNTVIGFKYRSYTYGSYRYLKLDRRDGYRSTSTGSEAK